MDNKAKILSNELQIIDNSINKRITTCYTLRSPLGKKNKIPSEITSSPIQYKINLLDSPKSYKTRNFYPNCFISLNKELDILENKKNNVNNRNRRNFLTSYINNYTSRNNNETKYYKSFSLNSESKINQSQFFQILIILQI